MNLFETFGLDQHLLTILAIDLTIAVVLLTLMRYLQGWSVSVSSKNELAERDNFAFGISTAGAITALAIVINGSVTGTAAVDYITEAIGMTIYSVFGLILIKFGRYLHDKVALNQINKNELIMQGNTSVAVVDACAAIATAIIIRAAIMWAEDLTISTFVAIFSAFLVSQLMLVILTRWRESRFERRNQGTPMQTALARGHMALAIRHGGYMLSMALSFNAVSHFIIYEPNAYVTNILAWLVFSILMLLALSLLIALIKKLILANINLAIEVEHQHNIGIASVEMAISISIALILTGLMA